METRADPVDFMGFFRVDVDRTFDEHGDEFDCRVKATHAQGNVGKASWVDLEGHDYTGIFQGADSGFVRLSPFTQVIEPKYR